MPTPETTARTLLDLALHSHAIEVYRAVEDEARRRKEMEITAVDEIRKRMRTDLAGLEGMVGAKPNGQAAPKPEGVEIVNNGGPQ